MLCPQARAVHAQVRCSWLPFVRSPAVRAVAQGARCSTMSRAIVFGHRHGPRRHCSLIPVHPALHRGKLRANGIHEGPYRIRSERASGHARDPMSVARSIISRRASPPGRLPEPLQRPRRTPRACTRTRVRSEQPDVDHRLSEPLPHHAGEACECVPQRTLLHCCIPPEPGRNCTMGGTSPTRPCHHRRPDANEIACPRGRHRRRGRRLQRPLPPHQARLEGRGSAGALRAHVRLHLARGRRHAHVQLRPQRRQAPGLHAEDLQGDRTGVRPVLRHPPHRRPHACRHPRPARLSQHRAQPRPLPRAGYRVHRSPGGGADAADHGPEALRRRALRPQRGPHRSVRSHPRLRRGGPQGPAARRSTARPSRDGPRPACPTAPGTW